jgi:hypothetical protein
MMLLKQLFLGEVAGTKRANIFQLGRNLDYETFE